MKITILSLWAHQLFRPDDPQPFGGAELQLYTLAKELARRFGVQVHFITRGRGPIEIYEHEALQVTKLPFYSNRIRRTVQGFYDCLHACFHNSADLFIQRGGGIETGIVGFCARRQRKPFVFMLSHRWDVDGTHTRKRGFLYGRVYQYGLKQASAVVAQTEEQQHLLSQNYRRESLLLRSAHTIPETLPENKTGILWVGRCEPFKNPELFLRVVEQLPQESFTMICPPANDTILFETIASQAKRFANLCFLPGVPFEESESFFATHKIMVNTSIQEGYPNTFVQAFKWGVPVISAAFDPDGILERHHMGECAGDEPDKIAASIRRLQTNDSLWKQTSQNARNFAIQNHDVHMIADKLYSFFSDLLKKNSNS